jgi:hypothetical protein
MAGTSQHNQRSEAADKKQRDGLPYGQQINFIIPTPGAWYARKQRQLLWLPAP